MVEGGKEPPPFAKINSSTAAAVAKDKHTTNTVQYRTYNFHHLHHTFNL